MIARKSFEYSSMSRRISSKREGLGSGTSSGLAMSRWFDEN